jgi:hypothetical protein
MKIPDGDLCLIRNNYRENLGSHTQSLTDCARELSRAALAQELVRRQEFCDLPMGGLERLDGTVQIKIASRTEAKYLAVTARSSLTRVAPSRLLRRSSDKWMARIRASADVQPLSSASSS